MKTIMLNDQQLTKYNLLDNNLDIPYESLSIAGDKYCINNEIYFTKSSIINIDKKQFFVEDVSVGNNSLNVKIKEDTEIKKLKFYALEFQRLPIDMPTPPIETPNSNIEDEAISRITFADVGEAVDMMMINRNSNQQINDIELF
jgi:hypothetical protein